MIDILTTVIRTVTLLCVIPLIAIAIIIVFGMLFIVQIIEEIFPK